MSEINLATGTVLFKGDMSQFEEDLKVGEKKLADLNKSLMTGGLKMQLYAAKAFNDELAKANKQAKRLMDEVKYGKAGLWWKEAGEKFKAGFDKFQSAAKGIGIGGTAVGGAALAAGASGSPLASSTLEGSSRLLMAEVGGIFTPLVKDVSKGLQDLAKSIRNLPDWAKNLTSGAAEIAGVAGLAALGLTAVSKGLTAIANHPIIATLTAGLTLGYASKGLSAFNDNKYINEQQARNQSLTMKDIEGESRSKQLESLSPRAAKLSAENDFRNAWEENEKKRTAYEEYRQGFGGMNLKGGLQRLADSTVTFGAIGEKLMQDAASSQAALEKSKLRYAKYGGELPGRKDSKIGADMLLGSAGAPSMLGVQELFKSFQMAGMGNQLEAEIKKTELKNMEKMLENTGKTATVLEDIKLNGLKMNR